MKACYISAKDNNCISNYIFQIKSVVLYVLLTISTYGMAQFGNTQILAEDIGDAFNILP